jgi:hypothetical protein
VLNLSMQKNIPSLYYEPDLGDYYEPDMVTDGMATLAATKDMAVQDLRDSVATLAIQAHEREYKKAFSESGIY